MFLRFQQTDHMMKTDSLHLRAGITGALCLLALSAALNGQANWLQRNVSGPSPRMYPAMAFDAVRSHALLFGGAGDPDSLGDTWKWDGTTWQEVLPSQSPPPLHLHAMAFDQARGEVVVFGGSSLPHASVFLNETWLWDEQCADVRRHLGMGRHGLVPSATPDSATPADRFRDDLRRGSESSRGLRWTEPQHLAPRRYLGVLHTAAGCLHTLRPGLPGIGRHCPAQP